MSEQCPFDPATFNANFDHHRPEFGRHREQVFDEMRGRCPVARTSEWGGFVILTKYDDVFEAARDDATFTSEDGITVPGLPATQMMRLPITIDPPESFKYRNILMRFFRASWLAGLEAWVNDYTDQLIDAFIEKGAADLQSDLAHPLTANFIMHITGLPRDLWWEYSAPVIAAVGRHGGDETRMVSRADTTRRLSEEISRQRAQPCASPDEKVLPYLLDVEIDGRKLTDVEVLAIMELLLDGGFDTTMAAMGHALLYLYRNPEKRRQLIEQPNLMSAALEEFLRWVTPQQGLFRTATRDTEIGGTAIRKGERVFLAWSAANHDPSVFQEPHEVRFDRPTNRHLSFGIGAHLCLGLNVARVEMRAVFTKVLQRLGDYAVDEAKVELPAGMGIVNGLEHLPVTFTPGKKIGAKADAKEAAE